jgi:hypothetical protein
MIIAGTSATKRSEIEMSLKSAHSTIIASESTKKRQRELEHERKQAQAVLSEQAPPPPTRQRTSGSRFRLVNYPQGSAHQAADSGWSNSAELLNRHELGSMLPAAAAGAPMVTCEPK